MVDIDEDATFKESLYFLLIYTSVRLRFSPGRVHEELELCVLTTL